jgi:predicted DCC family thiol-disulfide oxidoreductase YuxK
LPIVIVSNVRPTLIYDGDCGICRQWVRYWEGLTGNRIEYRTYQDAAADYPAIPIDAFRRAIQFVEPGGRVYAGAAATYRVLQYAPGRRGWWWLYENVPGFALASEWAYRFFASHRGLLNRLTRLLWGALEPPRYDLVRGVFLRGLGLIYLAAFASLGVQILGLVGSSGISPIASYLLAAQQYFGGAAYWYVPTLFWLDASDGTLIAATVAGAALAILLIAGIAVRPALVALFALYLSCTYAGQVFMSFQWDALLLETGFLAIFLPSGSRIIVWLYRWLIFRYMFMAGAAKLASGDATWRNLTALEYHFATQPLPTPVAWYVAQLPHWALAAGAAATLAIEVGAVFLIFAPRRLRAAAAWCIIVFQLLVALTGNYNFFNLLTILLCVFLFDDAALRAAIPLKLRDYILRRTPPPRRMAAAVATLLALVVVPAGVNRVSQLLFERNIPVASVLTDAVAPLQIVNRYGLFAVMTTSRPEIVVEGSDDGQEWREYQFRYKPGAESRRPPWNIPHQPRLDWQMWFAALGGWQEPWFGNFLRRLLQASPSVTALLAANPFPDHPPRYVRATIYDYRFATSEEHASSGRWWVRQREAALVPPVELADFRRSRSSR